MLIMVLVCTQEKNKLLILQNPDTSRDEMFWGMVINFNVNNGCVEYFVPYEFDNASGQNQKSSNQESLVIAECDMIGSKVRKLFKGMIFIHYVCLP
jgi:hypothetical protein